MRKNDKNTNEKKKKSMFMNRPERERSEYPINVRKKHISVVIK